jgi:hypothetical protein
MNARITVGVSGCLIGMHVSRLHARMGSDWLALAAYLLHLPASGRIESRTGSGREISKVSSSGAMLQTAALASLTRTLQPSCDRIDGETYPVANTARCDPVRRSTSIRGFSICRRRRDLLGTVKIRCHEMKRQSVGRRRAIGWRMDLSVFRTFSGTWNADREGRHDACAKKLLLLS